MSNVIRLNESLDCGLPHACSPAVDLRDKHVVAGEPMPHIIAPGHRTLWQKLRSEHPKYRAATVWKLDEYDSAPLPPKDEHV